MARQKHDLGVKKRLWQEEHQKPMTRNRRHKERIKRGHPGPLPYIVEINGKEKTLNELTAKELKEVLYGRQQT